MTRIAQDPHLKWLNDAEHWGEYERFDEVTGERQSVWLMKSKSSPYARFYEVGKGQVGEQHGSVLAATTWAYYNGFLGVCDDPMDVFLQLACRKWVLSGGADKELGR